MSFCISVFFGRQMFFFMNNLGFLEIAGALLWSDLYTARICLTDAAMCMNLINESLFNIVVSYVIF